MPADTAASDVLWAARQVIRQHREPPTWPPPATDPVTGTPYPVRPAAARCAQCDGGDPHCRMLVWARAELAAAP